MSKGVSSAEGLSVSEIKELAEIVSSNELAELRLRRKGEVLIIKGGKVRTLEDSASADSVSGNWHGASNLSSQRGVPVGSYVGVMSGEELAGALKPVAQISKGVYPQESTREEAVAAPSVQVVPPYREIKSPMVGTFYRRPSPDAEAFVNVGDRVRKGQVICIIEAMKVMNEVECDCSGTVVEVCLDDGALVEYGEVTFRIQNG